MQPILLVLLGLVSGTLSGLLGIGGGIVIVPALNQIFKVPMNVAVGTSLLIIIPAAISGSIAHYTKGNLQLGLAVFVMVGAVAGAAIGARIASAVPELWLKRAFALLLVYVAFDMFFDR
ncbi:MAG: hypothetical protein DIU83_07740 [Bacillota bacterium]|nr:MAG: hypothetical protein DIU83_07740 [Bacillota bacterium]